MPILLTLAAVGVGVLMAVQPAMNAQLSRSLGHPFFGAMTNFTLGFLALIVVGLTIIRPTMPKGAALSAAPWWAWLGGLLGATFVTCAILLIPRVGAVLFIAAALVGQLLAAAAMDQFALVGLKQQSLSPTRLAGIALLLIGLVLVLRGAAPTQETLQETSDIQAEA